MNKFTLCVLSALFSATLGIELGYIAPPVWFPHETSVGHQSYSQRVIMSTGLPDAGDVLLSQGSSIGVTNGPFNTPFSQQTRGLPPFMYQYYSSCITNQQSSIASAVANLPYLSSQLNLLLSAVSSINSDVASSNSWNYAFGCLDFFHTGASTCNNIPFGINTYQVIATSTCSNPGETGLNVLVSQCTPGTISCATITNAADITCSTSVFTDTTWCTPYSTCFMVPDVATGPSQQYYYGVPAVPIAKIRGLGDADIPFVPVTPSQFASNPNSIGLDIDVSPSILQCMVDPAIASSGILPEGPPVSYESVCGLIAAYLSLVTGPPSHSYDVPATQPIYPALPSYCSQWVLYESPTGPFGIASFFYPTGGVWAQSPTFVTPQFVSFNYTLTTSALTISDLQGGVSFNGQYEVVPNGQITVLSSKTMNLPSLQLSIYLPQDEGYYLYALDINGLSRSRRGCVCILLCWGLGGCGGGDVSGLKKLKTQIVTLTDSVAKLASGVGTFEASTSAYIKSMSAQVMTFMDATHGQFDKVWGGIDGLSSEIQSVRQAQLSLEEIAEYYADQAYEQARSNTLTLAQIKQQYGYRLGQLYVNVAVLRESVALSSLRAMQAGSAASSENYCETITPFLLSTLGYGVYGAPQLPPGSWPFVGDPSLGPITLFPGETAASTCFITIESPDTFFVTWKLPVYNSLPSSLISQGINTFPGIAPQFMGNSGMLPYLPNGLPYYFGLMSEMRPSVSDRYYSTSANSCGLMSSVRTYPHQYVDLNTGKVYGSHDKIDDFLHHSKGHPLLIDISNTHQISYDVLNVDGQIGSTPITFPMTNAGSSSTLNTSSFQNVVVYVGLDVSAVLTNNVSCPTGGAIDYTQYPPLVYFASAILPDAVRSLGASRDPGSFGTYLGLPSFRRAAPWALDQIVSFLTTQGMGSGALLSSALGIAIEAKLGYRASALQISEALQNLATSTNATISSVAMSILAQANTTGIENAIAALGNVISFQQQQLGKIGLLKETINSITDQRLVDLQSQVQADQNQSEALAVVADVAESNFGSLSVQYANVAAAQASLSFGIAAKDKLLAAQIANDKFASESNACSGLEDIVCMLEKFVEILLILAAIGLGVYLVYFIIMKIRAKQKTHRKVSDTEMTTHNP
jgi:hypothetical protein